MEAQGRVLRIEKSRAWVEVKRQSACSGNCRDCSGCEERAMETVASSEIAVSPGNWVLLRSEQGTVLFAMFAVFILPLILPLCVYLIAYPAKLAWLWACVALCCTFVLIWILSKSKWFLAHTMPKIIEILPEEKFK